MPAEFLAKPSRATNTRPSPPYISLQTALRLRPRRALSSAEAIPFCRTNYRFEAINTGLNRIPLLLAR
jgi:hypothetical protein